MLLILGLYLIFPACGTWLEVRREKNEPCELMATASGDHIDLNTVLQVEGVKKVTPVIRLDAELSAEEYQLRCEVRAVYGSSLDFRFTEGTIYPDSSSMPFLVLNQAAAKAFAVDEYDIITVHAGTSVLLKAGGAQRKAQVCGIIDDGRETPTVYMSYETASRAFPPSGAMELLLSLTGKGRQETVVEAIRRRGLSASADANESLRWELMEQRSLLFFLAGISFLACASILTRKNRRQELTEKTGEREALLASGFTKKETAAFYPLRLAMMEAGCLALAAAAAGVTKTFGFLSLAL